MQGWWFESILARCNREFIPREPSMTLLDAVLRWLHDRLRQFDPPGRPGPFTLNVTAQEHRPAMIVTATLPEKTAPDVASYELTYSVDGGPPVVATSTGDPIDFSAAVGVTLSATFVEIDGSGNRSDPSDPVTLVVADVIAPGRPGAFGLTVSGQD